MVEDEPEYIIGMQAGAFVERLRQAIVKHGDLPFDQYDNDTGTSVLTRTGFVGVDRHRDTDVLVMGNEGYDWNGGPSIPSSQAIVEIREVIVQHGDLPLYQRDADTGELLPIDDQEIMVNRGCLQVIPESYGTG